MKKRKILSIMMMFLISSCNTNTNNINDLDNSKLHIRDTYTNKYAEEKIPNQWEAYGIGDPFVYRFNGKYYLYASTKNYQKGIRCWVSDDLINFKMVDNKELDVGYASDEECTTTAYAPEVMYYNGYFYMCESKGGTGHYILKSDKPEGPFKAITTNFGEGIDGSFFIDDDEQIYFLRASTTGIRMAKLAENDNFKVLEGQKRLDNTNLGGWTEGPYLLKRNGIYYLTYTGNNVISSGYRIGYSYHNDDTTIFKRDAFNKGQTILLNTSDEFNGLGHSSTVLGPNMDAYYLAYHNLNSSGGPNRSFNLSRLYFNGVDMYVNNPLLNNNFTPEMPAFYTNNDDFIKNNDFYLSSSSTSLNFTAEYNFYNANNKCVFSYVDESNYNYLLVNNENEIKVFEVKNNNTKEIKSTKLNKQYDYSKLHTLRVVSNGSKYDVYFDNMRKISDEQYSFIEGKIGYKNINLEDVEYTAFSNYAYGNSDYEDLKQNEFLAANYSRIYSTIDEASLIEQNESEENEFNGKNGAYDVLLNKNGQRATYNCYFNEDGFYGFNITIDKKYCGKTITIAIDNKAYKVKVPTISKVNTQYVKLLLTEIYVDKGAHFVSFVYSKDEFAFHDVSMFVSTNVTPTYENSLENYISEGATYINSWKLLDNGHYALSGNRQCLYFGKNTLSNYTLECDVKLVGETSANTAGFLIRGNNPAFASSDNFSSVQGYYVSFNNSKFTISKCDYDNSLLDVSADAFPISSDEFHHIKIVANNNTITATFDGENTITFTDDIGFTYGYVGLYTNGAASVYKNLKIY